jgi:predicted LPLAT superfamily acyltransferase
MRRISRFAPGWISGPLLWVIALYFTAFPDPAAARASSDYLGAVLGRPARFRARFRHVRTFAQVIFERVELLDDRIERFEIRPVDHEVVLRRHGEGRGGVLLSAHFGSFEALRAFDRTTPGLRVRYLMFQQNAAMTARVLDSLNPRVAAQVIPLSDGPTAMLEARNALGEGEFVAFLGDRMPLANPRAEVGVEFLGRRVRFPRAPYLAAILAGVPLIVCFAPRTGPRVYEMEFREIYHGEPVAGGDRDAKCRELAQRYADMLSAMCRRHPYNWFNFFDIWS